MKADGDRRKNRRKGRMVHVDDLIKELQKLRERWGNTCCYVTGLAWGSVALWQQADYEETQAKQEGGQV